MAISRRDFLKAAGTGGALAAAGTLGVGSVAASAPARIDVPIGSGGRKPVFLPPMGNMDPATHAKNDVLFWSDQLTEHGLFLAMLMPGAEAAELRTQSLNFMNMFKQHFASVQAATVDESNFRDVNRATTEMVLPFIEFKRTIEDAQRSGRMHSLVWPTFSNHIAAEGDHFVMRLDHLSGGVVEFDLAELVPFWSKIMGEHALFAAHLLDPVEGTLIDQARGMAAQFEAIGSSGDAAALAAAGELILGFKETAETGIEAGQIQSIIHPALADHIRREAVKFLDELNRTIGTEVLGVQIPR